MPLDTYIAVQISNHKIVGIVDLRHHINYFVLALWGGPVGYSVRPSKRNKGYRTEVLADGKYIKRYWISV